MGRQTAVNALRLKSEDRHCPPPLKLERMGESLRSSPTPGSVPGMRGKRRSLPVPLRTGCPLSGRTPSHTHLVQQRVFHQSALSSESQFSLMQGGWGL